VQMKMWQKLQQVLLLVVVKPACNIMLGHPCRSVGKLSKEKRGLVRCFKSTRNEETSLYSRDFTDCVNGCGNHAQSEGGDRRL
jgi:hypothetical protein